MIPTPSRAVVPAVLAQHVGDAAALRLQRTVLVAAPHVELRRLARLDERLHAHLDGLVVAGDAGYRQVQEALESPGVGEIFTLAVLAIEREDTRQLDRLLALVDPVPEAARALVSAVGWVSAATVRAVTAGWLRSAEPLARWLGLAACAAHRVDAGATLDRALQSEHPRERSLAIRSAGVLGRTDRLPACLHHLRDDDVQGTLQAAFAATLLGDKAMARDALRDLALSASAPLDPAERLAALRLCLLAASVEEARAIVRRLAAQPERRRLAIQAAGWAGDLQAVPWLLQQMADVRHARVAGEAFTLLTGADLAALDLEGPTPPARDASGSGPNDDPADENVAMDADDSLPWPDVDRLRRWWAAQPMPSGGAAGVRSFLGGPVSSEHLGRVLRTGRQRQRAVAALLQVLRQPGLALFNVAAPAPRQRRLLGLSLRVV